jgi:voltage-gated potassium channel Kch
MSRGTASLIGWLGVVSLALIVLISIGLRFTDPNASSRRGHGIFSLLWSTFATTFSLAVPTDGTMSLIVIGLWFILAIGGIFIVSALVGLLTSGFAQKVEQLRKGRSPVLESDHTVILGWSDQVYTVVSELVEANRSRRRAAVAILAEQDKVEMDDALRRRLGSTATTKVICRTGSPLDLGDLELASLNEARSIIVLAPGGLPAEDADAYVLKVLLAINRGPMFRDRPHHVVAAVRSSHNAAVAELAGGDAVVIDGDEISARLVVQTARQPRLSVVYHDLLDYEGSEFYIVAEPRLVGRTFTQVLFAYGVCSPVGLLGPDGRARLNPPMDTVVGPEDRIILLAEDDSKVKLATTTYAVDDSAIVHSFRGPQAPESTLILGWNGRAIRILEQLDIYVTVGSTVDIVSDRSDADQAVAQFAPNLRKLTVRVKEGDTRDRGVLESLDITAYSNVIVLADDQLEPLAADSRVLVTLLHLRDMLARRGRNVQIVSEMRDDRDRALAQLTRADDFVVSEQLVSLLMTQISENRHLRAVFADLFDAEGSEIYIRHASYYVRASQGMSFATVVESARRRGEVAIGYRIAEPPDGEDGMVLNPDKGRPMPAIDRVIVLAEG